MTPIIEIDYIANVHTHLRETTIMPHLIRRALEGGVDVLGPMPNTDAGLTKASHVLEYLRHAKHCVPATCTLHFVSFVMITEETTERDIDECVKASIFDGKIYPRYRTTKSDKGVVRYGKLLSVIKHCGNVGMKVHVHPEHPSQIYGNRDAEFAFLPIVYQWKEETLAVIVWEHGTDARCIPHWKKWAKDGRFYLTLTAHHLAENEDGAFGDNGSVCKPPAKTEEDRQSLVDLVSENHPWVMAGADDAFHPIESKHPPEGKCACGDYTSPFLAPLYAHALDELLGTSKGVKTFVNFTSRNARRLHVLPDSSGTLALVREPHHIEVTYKIGSQNALPFWGGRDLLWSIKR